MALSLHRLFEHAAEKYANHVAVVFDDGQVVQKKTYSQVQHDMNVISDILKELGVKDGIVGLACSPCILLPSIILGVLKMPVAFHPINLDSGSYGLEAIGKLQIDFVLIDVDNLQKAGEFFGISYMLLVENSFFLQNGLQLVKITACSDTCTQEDEVYRVYNPSKHGLLAYCITTSGTTGAPKVVQVPHTCIVPNILHLRKIFEITDQDMLYLASPLTFDPSIVELFLALVSGAAILITTNLFKIVPKKFVTMTTRKHQVTVLQVTPTLLCNLGSDLIKNSILCKNSCVRILAFGGENCPSQRMLERWRGPGNTTALFNLYGTTEVSCWATCHKITCDNNISPGDDVVPLGTALWGTEIEVRGKDGCIITEGEGQLFIGGCSRVCVILGETDDQPADRVMRDTGDIVRCYNNSRLIYLGRKDQQIKRHGMRLNLFTLEEVVNQFAHLSSSAAVVVEGRLLLFVCAGQVHVDVSEIKHHVTRSLPVQYHPDNITVRNTMPTTKHGKVDKFELRRLLEADSPFLSSLSEVTKPEEILKLKWKEILSLENLEAPERSFLENGGDSFKAVRLAEEIESFLGRSFPLLLDKILHVDYLSVKEYLCDEHNIQEFLLEKGHSGSHTETRSVTGQESSTYQEHSLNEDSLVNSSMKHSTKDIPPVSVKVVNKNSGKTDKEPSLSDNMPGIFIVNSTSGETQRGTKRSNKDDISSSPKKKLCDIDIVMSVSRGSKVQYHTCSNTAPFSLNDKLPRNHYTSQDCEKITPDSKGSCESGHCSWSLDTDCTGSGDNLHTPVNLTEMWCYNTGKCVDSSPLLAVFRGGDDGLVIIGSHSHRLSAVSMTTGHMVWEVRLGDRVESSPCLTSCGQFVVVGCYDHFVYALNISDGHVHFKFQTGGEVKCSPTTDIQSNLIFIGSHDHNLYALNVQKQCCQWKKDLDGSSIFSSPSLTHQPHLVIAATLTGNVIAMKPVSGEKVWQYMCGKPVFSSPVDCASGVCVGCVDGQIYFINYSGQVVWSFETSGPVFSSPCLTHSAAGQVSIVVGSHDKHLYSLCVSGHLLWRYYMGAPVYSTPFSSTVYSSRFDRNCLPLTNSSKQCDNTYGEGKLGDMCHEIPVLASDVTDFCEKCQKDSRNVCVLTYGSVMFCDNASKHDTSKHDTSVNTFPLFNKREDGNQTQLDIHSSSKDLYGYLVVSNTDGVLKLLNAQTGRPFQCYHLPGEVFSSPVTFRNNIFVGCRDNNLYCLSVSKSVSQLK